MFIGDPLIRVYVELEVFNLLLYFIIIVIIVRNKNIIVIILQFLGYKFSMHRWITLK